MGDLSFNHEVINDRIAESLLVALSASRNTLEIMYTAKKVNSLSFIKDKQIESLGKALSKKFPFLDSKTNKTSNFKSQIEPILKLFNDYYNGIVELLKLQKLITALFQSLKSSLDILNVGESPDICTMFLEIVSNYVCCIYYFSKMEDRTSIIPLYALAYIELNSYNAPHFELVHHFINDNSDCWKKLSDDCELVFPLLQSIIASLGPDLKLKCIDPEQMETAAHFSLSSIPHELAIPVLCKNPSFLFIKTNDLCKWVFMSVLACPRLLIVSSGVESSLRTVLLDMPIISILKDDVINPFKELIGKLEDIKGSSRLVKNVQEWSQFSVNSSPMQHRLRRLHLRNVLCETYYFITDQPGLLGPKFVQICQLLASCFYEIEFYLISNITLVDTALKAKGKSDVIFDPDICTIIFYTNKIRLHLQKYSSIIQYYYYQFIVTHDLEGLNYYYNEVKDIKTEKSLVKSINVTIGKIPKLGYGKHNPNLETFSIFLDILRLQINNHHIVANYKKKTDSFVIFMNNMALHAIIANNTLDFIDVKFSYQFILFHQRILNLIFRDSLLNPIYGHYSLAIPECYTFLNLNSPNFYSISNPDIEFEDFFANVFDMITLYTKRIFETFQLLNDSIMSENMFIGNKDLSDIWLNSNLSHLDFFKKINITTKDISNVVSNKINSIISSEYVETPIYQFYNFCNIVSNTSEIIVEDVIFNVANFLFPEIDTYINSRLEYLHRDTSHDQTSSSVSSLIKKPSIALKEIQSLFESFSLLESCLNAKFLPLISASLLQHYAPKLPISNNNTLALEYGLWYIDDMINKRLKQEGMLYSPMRKCFVVKLVSNFPADDYVDFFEMKALAELLGPYGISTICDLICKYIRSLLEEIFKLMSSNICFLTQSSAFISDRSIMLDDAYRKFKYMDEIFYNLTLIGAVLAFREMILDGLRQTNESYCPVYSRVMKLGINNQAKLVQFYESFNFNPKTPINYHLLLNLSKSSAFTESSSEEVWTRGFLCLYVFMIPYLAISDTVEYIPLLDAHANNCNLICNAFHTLVPIFYKIFEKRITPFQRDENLTSFYKDLSVAILRMSSNSLFTFPIKDKDSVIVLYDLFMEMSSSNNLVKNLFDPIPYSLISQCYNDIYKRSKAKSKSKRSQVSGR